MTLVVVVAVVVRLFREGISNNFRRYLETPAVPEPGWQKICFSAQET
jgi:hypothetical protein